MNKTAFCIYAKTKAQISFADTAKLISTFVFVTEKVQSLFFLNPKFQASSHLLSCTARFVSELFEYQIVGFLMMWLKYREIIEDSLLQTAAPCSLPTRTHLCFSEIPREYSLSLKLAG